MLQVGITGGIGSGKTTVCHLFELLKVPVYYADDAAKRLMNEEGALKQSIIEHFGNDAYLNGELNRSHIASIVFNSEAKLKLLNSLVHPVTINDAANWMSSQKAPYSLKEAALIFESGSNKELDYVIGVSAPKNIRISRIVNRDNITEEQALKKMDKQMNEEEKMKLCDFLIYNDDKELIIPQVLKLHQQLLELSKVKS